MSFFDDVNPDDAVGNVDVSGGVAEGVVRGLLMVNFGSGIAAGPTAVAAGAAAGEGAMLYGASATTAATVGVIGIGAGAAIPPAIAAFLGLYSIARAHARGRQGGRRNAFVAAFSAFVVGASHGKDIRKRNAVYANSSIQGRNAAIHVLNGVSPARRRECLRHFGRMRQSVARAGIVAALGGYTTG